MRVLVVAQAFKETLSARQVATAVSAGVRAAGADPLVLIGSDGGDGLLEAMASRFIRSSHHQVSGPLGEGITVPVGWLEPNTAVVESRLVCGLSLVPENRRNPLVTTTQGVGELVDQIVLAGASSIFIGLGGSATMDGGLGMARAWGWIPLDGAGKTLGDGGQALAKLANLTIGRKPKVRLTGLVDVLNPLSGPNGARVYAAQKGATPEQADLLDRGLETLAEFADRHGKKALANRPGAGAAGGLGFGIMLFGDGTLIPGANWVLEHAGFAQALEGADLVISGEGSFDGTSLFGKLTGSVIDAARAAGKPVGIYSPTAHGVPEDILLETGGGRWTAEDVTERVAHLVERALRT